MTLFRKQEAQGACGTHLVLTNPLCFVGFFLVQNSISIWHWQLWNNSCKRELYCLKGCTISNVNATGAVVYNNKIILNLRYIFFILHVFDNLLG